MMNLSKNKFWILIILAVMSFIAIIWILLSMSNDKFKHYHSGGWSVETHNIGIVAAKLDLFAYEGEPDIEELKEFCSSLKDTAIERNSAEHYYMVLFNHRDSMVLPEHPIQSLYHLSIKPQRNIIAVYDYYIDNDGLKRSTLQYYKNSNKWDSRFSGDLPLIYYIK